MTGRSNALNALPTNTTVIVGNGTSFSNVAYSSSGGTSNIISRDSNGNTVTNNIANSLASNAGGSTVTLTAASARTQIFSGTGASTLVLPNANTLVNGWTFYVNNNTNNTITVEYNDTTTLFSVPSASYVQIILTSNGSSNGTWDYHWLLPATSSNGQVVIGSGTSNWKAATLTAGTGVSITNGSNAITINATGVGITWTDVTGTSATMAVNNGYLADNAGLVTLTLPATAAQFSLIRVAGIGAGGWTIAQNANQKIIFGSSTTTTGAGGSLSSSNANDCVEILATVGGANTTWTVLSSIGNLTVV